MTTPTNPNPISIQDLVNEFGRGSLSTPPAIFDYYRASGLVPNTTDFNAVPTGGLITLQDFYNLENTGLPGFISATQTGGTEVTNGNFKTVTFTGNGTFTITSLGNNAGSNSFTVNLAGAGGGGGGATTTSGPSTSYFAGGTGGSSTIERSSTTLATATGGGGGTSSQVQQTNGNTSPITAQVDDPSSSLTVGQNFSGAGFTGTGGDHASRGFSTARAGSGTGVGAGGGGGFFAGYFSGAENLKRWRGRGGAGSPTTSVLSPATASDVFDITVGGGGTGGGNGGSIDAGSFTHYSAGGGNGADGRVSITYQFQGPEYVAAIGGNNVDTTDANGVIDPSGDYRTHTFTGSGTLTLNTSGNSVGSNTLAITAIGAGGGGKGANNVADNQCLNSYPDPNGSDGDASTAVLRDSGMTARSTTTGAGGDGGTSNQGGTNQTNPDSTRRGDNFSGGGFTGTGGNAAHFATTVTTGNNTLLAATNGSGNGAGGGGGGRFILCNEPGGSAQPKRQFFEGGDAGSLTNLATSLTLNTGDYVDVTVGGGGSGGGNGSASNYVVSGSDPVLSAATRRGGSGSGGVVTITYKFQN